MQLQNFKVKMADISFVGQDLQRPESVLAMRDGTLYCSDRRGVATKITPDGKQTLVGTTGGEPNGLYMDKKRALYCANIHNDVLEKIHPDGRSEILLNKMDGKPLGHPNYITVDKKGAIWSTIMTRRTNLFDCVCGKVPDGYIVRIDENGAKIMADGLCAPNECRMDAEERYLYVAETMGNRMVRYPVNPDRSLDKLEQYGPDLGPAGIPDGFCFDAEGNIWITLLLRSAVVVLTPKGELHKVLEFGNEAAFNKWAASYKANTLTIEELFACANAPLPLVTSITFGGPDLKTAYLGSLTNSRLATFKSPVAGLPLLYW